MKTISFVIPVYNEEQRLEKTCKALQELQLPRGLKLEEVIFVNDGSTDKTSAMLRKVRIDKNKKRVKLISYKKNRGKGYAVREGMLASTADYTLFFDVDMSTPLTEISKFMPFVKKNIDVIVGTRKNGKSTVIKHQPLYREMLGKGFTLLTNLTLQTNFTDFTCGFKLFSQRAKNTIFQKAVINGWGYDVEVLFLAKTMGFSLIEKAVIWSNDDKSKVRLYKAIPQSLYDLVRIRTKHDLLPFLRTFAKNTPLRYGKNVVSS